MVLKIRLTFSIRAFDKYAFVLVEYSMHVHVYIQLQVVGETFKKPTSK